MASTPGVDVGGVPNRTRGKRNAYKFTPARRLDFLHFITHGLSIAKSADLCGIGRDRIYEILRQEPDFKSKVEEAKATACDILEDTVFEMARNGSLAACQMWLYNRSPERWRDRSKQPADAQAPAVVNVNINEVTKADVQGQPLRVSNEDSQTQPLPLSNVPLLESNARIEDKESQASRNSTE